MTSGGGLGERWSRLHGGMRPDALPLVRGWLRLMWRAARPLARAGVPPSAVTLAGAALGVASLAAALAHGRAWAAAALALMLTSALADGVDGAVAILRDCATAAGARLDRFADRVVDACWALALWGFGAPLWAGVALVLATVAQERWRAALGDRAGDLVTVCERPTRLICAALAAVCMTIAPGATWTATVCAGAWAMASLVAGAQLGARAAVGRTARGTP